jgi:spartin
MGGQEEEGPVKYPNIGAESRFAGTGSSSLYPEIENAEGAAYEERLVTIPGAMVHLVDAQESVLLGSGDFSVVRISQGEEQGVVALVRVGENLTWPLVHDEQVVKLDPIHYVFSLPVADATTPEAVTQVRSGENMHYGVTFSAAGHEEKLKLLDDLLGFYSFFSLPTLVHGDKQKEAAEKRTDASKEVDTTGAAVVPASVVAGDGKQITEANQRMFWTEMAPNVNDYGNSVAKAIASGTGQIIRGIFWIRDSTVQKLESGSLSLTQNSHPTDNPSNISPATLRNLHRVNDLSKATDNFAKSVLSGVVSTVAFIPNAIATSRVGRAFFKTGPGEVALASMVSFWKVFDAVEQASRDVLRTGTAAAATVVTHKYGEPAGTATGDTLGTAGHLVGTAWSVAKLPKALNPTAALRPSRATMMGLNAPKKLT